MFCYNLGLANWIGSVPPHCAPDTQSYQNDGSIEIILKRNRHIQHAYIELIHTVASRSGVALHYHGNEMKRPVTTIRKQFA
ncbi:hypothetical protein OUZ56_022331 [Daphnia magna]|uniref:Uncharacterized protein n=1 Tax=Daphnia magna TaxID=35525 RepID=A0ABR0AW17_9CRUS|nr:hypothetical protein OUZ56_022331 [Daphnia magna]